MIYSLVQIVEHDLSIRPPSDEGTEGEEVVAQWSFGLLPKFTSEKQVEIYISAVMTPGDSEDNRSMVEISVTHIFQLADPSPLYPFSERSQITEEQKMELATLVGVSVGTLRGLAYARTSAFLGSSLIMPVLNPIDMLEHFLSVKEEE